MNPNQKDRKIPGFVWIILIFIGFLVLVLIKKYGALQSLPGLSGFGQQVVMADQKFSEPDCTDVVTERGTTVRGCTLTTPAPLNLGTITSFTPWRFVDRSDPGNERTFIILDFSFFRAGDGKVERKRIPYFGKDAEHVGLVQMIDDPEAKHVVFGGSASVIPVLKDPTEDKLIKGFPRN